MIKILCIGKLKEKYLTDAVNEYYKRIKKYTNIELVELQECSIDDKNIALEKEKKLILKNLNPRDYIITLEIDGKEFSSLEFAKKIDTIFIANSNIVFVIGGSYGLHDDVKDKANFRLSFSKMTFPHQLFRVLLLEQVYRAYKINNKEKYHK